MGLFSVRRREYRDTPEISRWHALFGPLFILACAVVVAKLADLQFDRFFYSAASVSAVILVASKQRLAYICAAFGWMGLRLLIAGAVAAKWWVFGVGGLFVGVAYAALRIAVEREEFDRISKGWRG